ncbi:MAG: DUF2905 domain-containing protein [Niabella sp.]
MHQAGKYMVVAGVLLIIVGVVLWLSGNRLNFLGRLPGDIRIEKENFKFYFPVTTLILISLIVNGIIWLIRRFF